VGDRTLVDALALAVAALTDNPYDLGASAMKTAHWDIRTPER